MATEQTKPKVDQGKKFRDEKDKNAKIDNVNALSTNLTSAANTFLNNTLNKNNKDVQSMSTAIQGNMVQSALDAQLAEGMAYTNAAINSDLMNQTAALELQNTSEIMALEQQYGLAQMGAQAELQNEFQNQEVERSLIFEAAMNTYEQANMNLQGQLNLEQIEAQLTGQGVNEQELQKLVNSGALEQLVQAGTNEQTLQTMLQSGAMEQLNNQNAAALAQIAANGAEAEELQVLVNSGALDQINAQNKGTLDALIQSGTNDRQLQAIVNSGALDQIDAQSSATLLALGKEGANAEALQSLVNSGAIDQLDITTASAEKIQDMVNTGALAQINAQMLEQLMQLTRKVMLIMISKN